MKYDFILVSVKILAYNQEKTIARTIESILAQQTGYSYEIIIGEDASSDRTREICEDYVAKYPEKIHLLPKAPNKGLIRNFKDCLAACKGKYIMGCAADDWWHNVQKIELQVSFLEANQDFVLSYGGFRIYNTVLGKAKDFKAVLPRYDLFTQLLENDFIIAPTVCFRREMLQYLNFDLFVQQGICMEDYPMWLTMCEFGRFHCVEVPLVTYTIQPGSISHSLDFSKQEKFEYSVLQCRLYFLRKKQSCKITEEVIMDYYYRGLASVGIKCNNRKYYIKNISQVKIKKIKDRIIILLSYLPGGLWILNRRNAFFSLVS